MARLHAGRDRRPTERIAENIATARAHAERAGRDPAAITCATLPLLLCHPDRDKLERWLDHPFMQWHALTGFPFGKSWRDYGHVHPLGDGYSITLEGNMATMPIDRVLDLCRQVPRAMVRHALHCGTPDDVVPRLVAQVHAGVRHFALCNYVGFLSRADAPPRRRRDRGRPTRPRRVSRSRRLPATIG